MAPARLFVQCRHREIAHRFDNRAVCAANRRGKLAARGLVHERHELVREARHRAADADSADVGTTPDAADPTALGNVAFDDRTPAADFYQALRRVVFGRELALFVVPCSIATLVDGVAEEPRRPPRLVERDHRRFTSSLPEQVQDRFGEVVGVDRAARHANDGYAVARFPIPAEIIEDAHGACRIARHRVDTTVCGACPDREDRPCLWREPIDPARERDRLIRARRVAEAGEVAFLLNLFVCDRTFEH